MFLEPSLNQSTPSQRVTLPTGWIEVICGCMFSGKTEELIRRVRRADLAKQKVRIFKPALDVRYDEKNVVSHNKNQLDSLAVSSAREILENAQGYQVVAIDEAQFFDLDLVEVVNALANRGQRVIISGLDMDFEGQPFPPMPQLISVAEFVTKLHAICMQCGTTAHYSYRLVASSEKLLLGEKNEYEARCRQCFHEGRWQEHPREVPTAHHPLAKRGE